MEESKLRRYGFVVLLLAAELHGGLLQTQTICPIRSYSMDPTREHCYRYVESPQDFFGANRTCEREGGGELLHIDSAAEDEYVRMQFYMNRGRTEFWIGLNDIDQEGTFRWVDGTAPVYTNWSQATLSGNAPSQDCVLFSANGWSLLPWPRTCGITEYPFVCKMNPCQTNDGSFCIGSEPTAMPVPGPDVGLIAGIVVVILIIIAVIVGVVVLLVMWKFCNDAFYRYICCCVSGGSRSAMHSLQQENQRLRHELSQNKMSFSGRYSQGQFTRELSGVPDGRGGVLPTIKQPLGTAISPTIPEDGPLVFPTSQPPPLALQRSISRPSRVTPFTSPLPLSQSYYTPGVFTPGQRVPLGALASFPPGRPARQSAPVQKPTVPPLSVKSILTDEEVTKGEEKLKGEEGSGEKASEHDTSTSSSTSSVHTPEEKAT